MPKDTYFRLPAEKQKRLLEAARAEFSRVPLQDASISNIVRLAEIPRGSFYQYFEDKEDLYYYYFGLLRADGKNDLEILLRKNKGDIFAVVEQYFNKMTEQILIGPDAPFYKNLFMHMDYHGTNRVTPEMADEEDFLRNQAKIRQAHRTQSQSLLDLIDQSLLKTADTYEVVMLIRLFFSMYFSTINHAYKRASRGHEMDIEATKREFATKLAWLKYGVYQNEEGVNE